MNLTHNRLAPRSYVVVNRADRQAAVEICQSHLGVWVVVKIDECDRRAGGEQMHHEAQMRARIVRSRVGPHHLQNDVSQVGRNLSESTTDTLVVVLGKFSQLEFDVEGIASRQLSELTGKQSGPAITPKHRPECLARAEEFTCQRRAPCHFRRRASLVPGVVRSASTEDNRDLLRHYL